jgi:hypothetical protein
MSSLSTKRRDDPGDEGRARLVISAFIHDSSNEGLENGVLSQVFEHDLLRVQCARCGDITVVAFSCCRGRGFCPSCGGRRMSQLATHLVDRVIPHIPIRQWVFTVPVPGRTRTGTINATPAHLRWDSGRPARSGAFPGLPRDA